MTVKLTVAEIDLILYALRIAAEDESIYGADEDYAKTNAVLESVRRKLGD
jgi:hypothetical protein